jgi:hypothetical protein
MPASPGQRWFLSAQVIVLCAIPAVVYAQPRGPQMPAPPPMRLVSLDERAQLTASKDSKARLRTTIEIGEIHLGRAEVLTTEKKFDQALEEVGRYLGLIEDARRVLADLNSDKNSTRDLYRRFDIALRAHVPRLAVLRRTTPTDYASHIKAAEEVARDTRSEALDSFYGHSVLREDAGNKKKPDAIREPPESNKRP